MKLEEQIEKIEALCDAGSNQYLNEHDAAALLASLQELAQLKALLKKRVPSQEEIPYYKSMLSVWPEEDVGLGQKADSGRWFSPIDGDYCYAPEYCLAVGDFIAAIDIANK